MRERDNDPVCRSVPSLEPRRLMFALGVGVDSLLVPVGHRWHSQQPSGL